MEVVNDARLLELVREPARELLPAARRASVVQPLLVLLAFLPGLIGFWSRSLDEATCRQGLLAFEVAAGDRPKDWFVTASRSAMESSSTSFPLATLLTAVGLQVELLTPESRLLLVSYASSVFLLLCLGGLAKQVGGSRFALLTVCLACGHRAFLALSESLPPVALPLAFAVLSFRALLAHQVAERALVSWSLLASGLALAVCWLTGGELAIASLGVLLATGIGSVFLKKTPLVRSSLSRVLRQRFLKSSVVVMRLLIVSLIAVAIVVGWQSAFSSQIHLPNIAAGSVWFRKIWPFEARAGEALRALSQMIGAWVGFVVLGLIQVARGRMPLRDGASTSSLAFLVGWIVVGGLSWWMTWPVPSLGGTNSVSWTGFLLLPLLFLAACGLDGVLRREFGLGIVLSVTLVTLAIVSAPNWTMRLSSGTVTGLRFVSGFLAATVVVGVGWLVIRRVAKSEPQSRFVLLSCVAVVFLVDVTQGIVSRPQLADDERELLAFRRQLIKDPRPDQIWLLTEGTAPLRLRFFLWSLWNDVTPRVATDWKTVFAELPRISTPRPHTPGMTSGTGTTSQIPKARAIVVTWGSSKLPADNLKRRGEALTQASAPHYFQGRILKSYHWYDRAEGTVSR